MRLISIRTSAVSLPCFCSGFLGNGRPQRFSTSLSYIIFSKTSPLRRVDHARPAPQDSAQRRLWSWLYHLVLEPNARFRQVLRYVVGSEHFIARRIPIGFFGAPRSSKVAGLYRGGQPGKSQRARVQGGTMFSEGPVRFNGGRRTSKDERSGARGHTAATFAGRWVVHSAV